MKKLTLHELEQINGGGILGDLADMIRLIKNLLKKEKGSLNESTNDQSVKSA